MKKRLVVLAMATAILAASIVSGLVYLGHEKAAFTPLPTTKAVTNLSDLKGFYEKAGAHTVRIIKNGDVNESLCMVVEAYSDVKAPNDPYSGQVTLVVTSDTEVPDVIGLGPIEASAALREAGLNPTPGFITYERSSVAPKNPTVTSCAPGPGSVVRVGETVAVEYSDSLIEYS